MYIRGLIQRNFAELAEADAIVTWGHLLELDERKLWSELVNTDNATCIYIIEPKTVKVCREYKHIMMYM